MHRLPHCYSASMAAVEMDYALALAVSVNDLNPFCSGYLQSEMRIDGVYKTINCMKCTFVTRASVMNKLFI